MTHSNFVVLALLLLCSEALSNQDEVLDNSITSKRPTNEPPTFHHKFKRLVAIAGKPFRYIIPPDAFTDSEDGNNLTYTVFESENVPLRQESWLQYNSSQRMLYGLPSIEHVDRWNYIIEAKDSEGYTAQGTLDIRVLLRRRKRHINNNHEFIIKFKPLDHPFKNSRDWQLERALEGIANVHKDADMHHLKIIDFTEGGVSELKWMNDSLPNDPCPVDDFKKLMKVMESELEHGRPSSDFIKAMYPDLEVLEIMWRGTEQCATIELPKVSFNHPPILRNAIDIDHLTARVGHLLVYRVPEDTFFDPEDGNTRNLHLSLRFSDNSSIPSNHWLQFDAQKQELFGVPSPNDVNEVNYVLIAEDSGKKVANDTLLIEIAIETTIELQVIIEPSVNLLFNANNKRKIIEKVATLLGQRDTNSIRIKNINDNPSTITLYNVIIRPKIEINTKELQNTFTVEVSGDNAEQGNQIGKKDVKITSFRIISISSCTSCN